MCRISDDGDFGSLQLRSVQLEYDGCIGMDGDEAQLAGKEEEEEEVAYIHANGNDNETDYVKLRIQRSISVL